MTLVVMPSTILAQNGDIWVNQLRSQVGAANVDGTGVSLLQVEAPEFPNGVAGGPHYTPDSTHSDLSSKTFTDPTGNSQGASGHATTIGRFIYGTGTTGVAPGLGEAGSPPITNFEANDWVFDVLGANFVGDTTPDQAPTIQNFDVANHSWVGRTSVNFTVANAENALQRIDWLINQTDTTTVVGTDNSGSTPELFAHSYNAISVGSSDATNATSLTSIYGAGRLPIDIVAPTASTSVATALVSGGAAILHQTGSGISEATRSEVVKATLLAGASKQEPEFAGGWGRTATSPLDQEFGAGELHVLNSYNIQQAGQINGEAGDPINTAGENGWDFHEDLATGDDLFYEFVVGSGDMLEDFSIILSWNAVITDTNATAGIFDPSFDVADLSLELYDSSNGFLNQLVTDGLSDSPVDNVEHLYFSSLSEGIYHLRVANNATGSINTDYALAFRSVAVPEPGVAAVLCFVFGLAASRRRRRS